MAPQRADHPAHGSPQVLHGSSHAPPGPGAPAQPPGHTWLDPSQPWQVLLDATACSLELQPRAGAEPCTEPAGSSAHSACVTTLSMPPGLAGEPGCSQGTPAQPAEEEAARACPALQGGSLSRATHVPAPRGPCLGTRASSGSWSSSAKEGACSRWFELDFKNDTRPSRVPGGAHGSISATHCRAGRGVGLWSGAVTPLLQAEGDTGLGLSPQGLPDSPQDEGLLPPSVGSTPPPRLAGFGRLWGAQHPSPPQSILAIIWMLLKCSLYWKSKHNPLEVRPPHLSGCTGGRRPADAQTAHCHATARALRGCGQDPALTHPQQRRWPPPSSCGGCRAP